MISAAYDHADLRDPLRVRQRVFLVDGNKQQITAIGACAKARGLKVPVLIDFIHVSGYLGKAAAALHPGDPQAAREWADGQRLRVLHGRAKAAAATCGRAFGTPCIHEHACVRCPMLWPDPAQRDRLTEIRDNLIARIAEAEREGWRGEAEGLKISLAGAEDKLTQISRRLRTGPVHIGLPALASISQPA